LEKCKKEGFLPNFLLFKGIYGILQEIALFSLRAAFGQLSLVYLWKTVRKKV
jgi:hypothetical protein